jgi:hypothetical protein
MDRMSMSEDQRHSRTTFYGHRATVMRLDTMTQNAHRIKLYANIAHSAINKSS